MAGSPFTLQLLHGSDFEAGLLAASGSAKNFAAIIAKFRADYANTLTLGSGNLFIPGPFNASETDPTLTPVLKAAYAQLLGVPVTSLSGLALAPARVDIAIMNLLGIQASAVGNHDFDFGPSPLNDATGFTKGTGTAPTTVTSIGAQFPYLSANLDFSKDSVLASKYTTDLRDASTYAINAATLNDPTALAAAAANDKSFAPWTIVTVNGEKIGIVGLTTQVEASITSLGGVTVKDPAGDGGRDNTTELAQIAQGYVDQLTAQGINKIIVTSHLQQYQLELHLATKLKNVDIIVAGGSHAVFANPSNPQRPGEVIDQAYPVIQTGADGNPVAVVNVGNEYQYVGRLVVQFDANGVIVPSSIDRTLVGDYATTDDTVKALYGATDPFPANSNAASVKALADAVNSVISAKDGNVFGYTDVYLEGRRTPVRTQETNLGDLSADANLYVGKQFDPGVTVSIKNGGGIRAEIGAYGPGKAAPTIAPIANPAVGKLAGGVSQLDIENSMRFNNALSVVSVTAQNLVRVLEYSAALVAPGTTPGGFDQVGGIAYSFDPSKTAQVLDANGNVTTAGQRVQTAAILNTDGSAADTLVKGGVLQGDPNRVIKVVTLSFIADGGDSNPLKAYTIAGSRTDLLNNPALPDGVATFAAKGSEQDAFAEYMAVALATKASAYAQADVPASGDQRIQDLSQRSDTVLQGVQAAPVGGGTLTGTDASDLLIGATGARTTFVATAGRDTYKGAGQDQVVFSVGRGQGKVARDLTGAPVSGFVWTDAKSQANVTRFSGVKQVDFTDSSVIYDPLSTAATVSRTFKALLGRDAETQALSFYTDAAVNRRVDVATLGRQIAASSEGQSALSKLSDTQFIGQVYSSTLGRGADTAGSAYWTAQLARGANRADVAATFASSTEAQLDATGIAKAGLVVNKVDVVTVGADYRALLGRDADQAGLTFWTSALKTAPSNDAIVQAMANSSEFAATYAGMNNPVFVDTMYNSAMGREADSTSTFWTDALTRGALRSAIAAAIVNSPEAKSYAATYADTGIRVM